MVEDIDTIKQLEESVEEFEKYKARKEEKSISRNYIFGSKDNMWILDLEKYEIKQMESPVKGCKLYGSKSASKMKNTRNSMMTKMTKIHLMRADDFQIIDETEDPYKDIRDYLKFKDLRNTQIQVVSEILNLFSGEEQKFEEEILTKEGRSSEDCVYNGIFEIRSLKKNAKNLWPEVKKGVYFKRFLPSATYDDMIEQYSYQLTTDKQYIILVSGMLMLLEELTYP